MFAGRYTSYIETPRGVDMKKILLGFLGFLLTLGLACSKSEDPAIVSDSVRLPTPTTEAARPQPVTETRYYLSMLVADQSQWQHDGEEVLRELLDAGVRLREAWIPQVDFPECTGQTGRFMVTVDVTEGGAELEKRGFVGEPPEWWSTKWGSCALDQWRYQFVARPEIELPAPVIEDKQPITDTGLVYYVLWFGSYRVGHIGEWQQLGEDYLRDLAEAGVPIRSAWYPMNPAGCAQFGSQTMLVLELLDSGPDTEELGLFADAESWWSINCAVDSVWRYDFVGR